MSRIFTSLAVFSVLLLCVNLVLGLRIGDYNGQFARHERQGRAMLAEIQELKNERPRPLAQIDKLRGQLYAESLAHAPIKNRALVHMLMGVAAALVAVLVNSICVTYFIGTSRWVREVIETYDFPRAWIGECNALKRKSFLAALVGMLTAVGIIALGAAAHPGTIRAGTAAWVTPHLIAAIAGTGLIAWMFYIQQVNIAANYQLLQRIVARVVQVRREKGLDIEESQNADDEKPVKPEYA